MTSILNLTPHAIGIYAADGVTLLLTVPPSGIVARVTVSRVETGTVAGLPIFGSSTGAVTGLPDIAPDTILIVSAMVRLAVPSRRDVLSPGELIRDAAGQPVGCRGLDANT